MTLSVLETARAGLPADRADATVLAIALIEQVQVTGTEEGVVETLLQQARARDWGEVEVLLRHGRLVRAARDGSPAGEVKARADAMLAAAESVGEELLVALALAARAAHLSAPDDPRRPDDDLPGCLARAVAVLDDVTDAPPHEVAVHGVVLTSAFVECGQAYLRRDLWELEEEMYDRASRVLVHCLDGPAAGTAHFVRRVLLLNRLESRAAHACAWLEIGDREQARRVAAGRPVPSQRERADLPSMWAYEAQALERLLDVLAGVPVPAGAPSVAEDLLARLEGSTWGGYGAAVLLAAAVGRQDAGETAGSAALAEQAVGLLDEYLPSLRTLALALAAQAGRPGLWAPAPVGEAGTPPVVPVPRITAGGRRAVGDRPQDGGAAARRYARDLSRRRWQARLQILGASRARLAAEQVLRHGEALSRQAHLDALTGLANRHALGRRLTRLRGGEPGERIGAVLVDVDHFKQVNDRFGHGVGDEVLRLVAVTLQRSVRQADLAVRLGGDELLLLLDLRAEAVRPGPGGGRDVAAHAHAVVRSVARQPWQELAPDLRVTVSVGGAAGVAPEVDALLQVADEMLYRAKSTGRGRAVTT